MDKLVLGGGMVFTFLKARGIDVGNSLVEDDQVQNREEIRNLFDLISLAHSYCPSFLICLSG